KKSGEKTRKDRGDSPGQLAVDHFNLGKISNFSRPADVTQRRQQMILHDGPQQDISAETLRTSLRLLQQLCCSNLPFADKEIPTLMAHRRSHFIFKIKTQSMRRRNLDLSVIAGGFQFLVAIEQGLINLVSLFQCRAINRLRDPMQ